MKSKTKYIVIAFLTLVVFVMIAHLFFNGNHQIKAAGLLIACLILWISEAFPISISTLLMVSFLPFIGLMDLNEILSNFGINTALFIMASSGITVALASSAIPKFLMNQIIKRCRNNPNRLILSIALTVAFFSAFVSSLATCMLFSALISFSLKKSGIRPKESNLGKNLMLVIPACAGIGGFMSPAGTPANMLVIDLLQQQGIKLSFLNWCAIGFPIGIFAVLLFACCTILVFKPEPYMLLCPTQDASFSKKDKWTLIIVLFVIAGWFVGSFVPLLSTTLVALIGLGAMFLPSLNLLNMETFSKGVNWDLVVTMGSVTVIMTAVSKTEILSNAAGIVFENLKGIAPCLMLVLISFLICLIRSVIPTTTAVIAIFAPIMISIADSLSFNVAPLLLIVSFWAASALLLIYTEPIYLIAYKEGFFSELDLLRVGIIPSIILSIIATLGIYGLAALLGF